MEAFSKNLFLAKVLAWDAGITFLNTITPSKKPGSVIPEGHPGAGGKWPEFISPREGDSRCSCPAINAMANHGILPRDGKNISFKELGTKIEATYNFAATFCYFVPNFAANMLKRDYETGTFDLKDLDLHNGIEHDASLTRQDAALEPDQTKPHVPFIEELLDGATGKDDEGKPLLTIEDISRYSTKRRVEARETNTQFTLENTHKLIGSTNASNFAAVFGGRIDDLRTFLLEERLPDGWEPHLYEPHGLSIIKYYRTVISKVEAGIDEAKFIADREEKKRPANEAAGEALLAGEYESAGQSGVGTSELRRRVQV